MIEGFSRYSVSCEGEVKSIKTGRILKQNISHKGYLQVTLYNNDDKKINRTIHRLVAEAFIPNPNNLPQVNHIDEDKLNPDVYNLEWCTNEHNIEHSQAKHYKFINPEGDVVDIFNLSKFCRVNALDSSKMFRVLSGKFNQHKGWRLYSGNNQ